MIRDIESIQEMRLVEELQQEVWGFSDREIVPLVMMIPTIAVGGTLIGAFDGATLAGFVYGFIGYESGRTTMHSDMLAVKPAYRRLNLGYRLKLAQRERALAQGIDRMTWTFDPLQSRNAYLNFAKLGVVADTYKVNFYGEATASFLHQETGTDRLWVTWLLDSQRVRERLTGITHIQELPSELNQVTSLVNCTADGSPQVHNLAEAPSQDYALIEIPDEIDSVKKISTELAVRWRKATRQAFTEALAAKYTVKEFYRPTKQKPPSGVYLLGRSTRDGAVAE